MPERIQRQRTRGWRMPDNTVSVTRPSKWGNPVNGKTCAYKPGKDYAVCPGRGKHQLGRMRVLMAHCEVLGQITDADAVREGFEDREAFVVYWTKLYGRWDPLVPVWCIEFELITPATPTQEETHPC